LDEPTNDLDVQTLAVLEEYLEDFNGCVIVVSHDRYFLDRTVEMVFSFEPEGEIRLYPGNYSIYLEYKKDEAEQEASDAKAQSNKGAKEQKFSNSAPFVPDIPKVETKKLSQLSYKEKREYEELEAKIPKLEEEKTQAEKKLYHNAPSGHAELQKLAARLAELNQAIEKSTERWLALAERI
jgi:ATP-binding cassette subfamily F protein uup